MICPIRFVALAAVLALVAPALHAQVPQLINYQGRVAVGSPPVNFDGSGAFKFALVNADGTTTFWSNDGTSTAGSQPTAAVTLTVTKGLYSVLLGDATLPNMTVVPATVFTNADVRLRVWFDDGTNGSQLLTPDQRIAAVGYAMIAGSVPDGAITSEKIASGAVGAMQLATGAMAAPVSVAGTTQAAAANTSYLATSASQTSFTLPPTANVGDVVRITGAGAGGWTVLGNEWTARESNRQWKSVASSADGTRLVAVAFDDPIHTSTDSGVTWTPRESNRRWQSVASSADGTKLVAVVQDGQIYTSTDSGVTWTPRESDRRWDSVASSEDGTKLVAAVYGGLIYTSADSGVTWTPHESDRVWTSVASSADGTKLVATVDGGQIYTSADAGVSWTVRDGNRFWRTVASSADGTNLVAVVYGGRIYTSTDSGASWTPRESDRTWDTVASSADGTKLVAAAEYGRIYTSRDSGANWTPQEGDRNWNSVASSADGNKLVAVVGTGGRIYTDGVTGSIHGSLSGAQGTAIALQYLGNGEWVSVGQTQIAAGAVGSTQLAADAVLGAHIATGSIRDSDVHFAANIAAYKLGDGFVSDSEFNHLAGVTANIQTQLDAKLALDGGTLAGALTAPAHKLPSPQTFVRQISANGFVPDTNSETYDRGAGLISPAGGDTQLQFLANVHLPDGATITRLVAVFFDSNTENFTDIDVRLRYFSTTSLTAVTMAEILDQNTVGISTGRVEFEDATIAGAVIDNTARAYTVDAAFTVDSATSNTRFYGVRIEYTLDTLLP